MTTKRSDRSLIFPFPEPPAAGESIEIAEGILWVRIPLPFQLNHVNVYLIDDGEGWAVLDTGIANDATRASWEALLPGPLAGRRLTRLIVTHYHPDHIGLAGWLAERYDLPLLTTQTTYLQCLNISLRPGALDAKVYRDFYLRNGLDAQTTAIVTTQGHNYLKMVSPLPPTFQRITAGRVLKIGGRRFSVLTGDGHAPEQAMLYCPEEKIFFAADQVLEKISPNVSVWAVEPQGDPLGLYLRSLQMLAAELPEDTLVLPGHHRPFRGLYQRIAELNAHHEKRCAAIAAACKSEPKSASELLPVMFNRALNPHEMSFAFSEVLAHMNYMLAEGLLIWAEPSNGITRVITLS
jgi:glyoxylase-like metal-dependent hydrolase (beta-lactamase superfamily II)